MLGEIVSQESGVPIEHVMLFRHSNTQINYLAPESKQP
jgi:hypothetical protein